MDVITVPCLDDNFSYLLICQETKQAAIVDPAEMEPVEAAIKKHLVEPVAILNTHHHHDHVGANQELLEKYPDLKIYAHESQDDRVPGQTEFLKDRDPVSFGNQKGVAYFNPGHTESDINYVFKNAAFVGDTLFSGGCGRLLGGTASQMFSSLNVHLKALSPETKIYFAHEYTEANLKFALSVEPQNPSLLDRVKQVQEIRAKGDFTSPTTLEIEQQSNPFLRCFSPEIHANISNKVEVHDFTEENVFQVLRELKDDF